MQLNGNNAKEKAVSLIELTIVIFIIGFLATLAIPSFMKAFENAKADEAEAALEQIRTAERAYRTKEDTYWPTAAPEADIDIINCALNIYLNATNERNWNYSITATADTFTATATRRAGRNRGETITIDEKGDIGGTWSP